jgi:hypothetical protein
MKSITVFGQIDENNQLILDESLDVIKPQRVDLDIWFNDDEEDEEDEYREPSKAEILAGIREGFHDCLTGNTSSLEEMWEELGIKTTGTINDDGQLLLDQPLPATAHKFVNVVIWFTSNKTSIQEIAEALGREPQSFPAAELAMSGK